MFKLRADLVVLVLDGYTGKALNPAGVRVILDGSLYRPQYKEGGYMVFINIEPGEHEIILKSTFFLDESFRFTVSGEGFAERIVTLKPADNYSFGKNSAHVIATVRQSGAVLAGAAVRFAISGSRQGNEIKIAQGTLNPGDTDVRLFIKGGAVLNLPMEYLFVSDKNAEINTLTAAEDNVYMLQSPSVQEYKRGDSLYPAAIYETDEDGIFSAYVREPGKIFVFAEDKLTAFDLTAGENNIEIDV